MVERRAAVRYGLCLPIRVILAGGELRGRTTDISTRGIHFQVDKYLMPLREITLICTLPSEVTRDTEVNIHAIARIVRVIEHDKLFNVAAEIENYKIIRTE